MSQGRIIINEPNGVQRSRPLPPQGLNIGRGSHNDLVIGYTYASRNHAQITTDGKNYYVTDLESGNGTFLNEEQLPPNQPILWNPDDILRIGNVSIQLIASPQTQPSTSSANLRGDSIERSKLSAQQAARRREAESTSTIYWSPEERETQKRRFSTLTLALLFLFLCLCPALAGASYYFYYQ